MAKRMLDYRVEIRDIRRQNLNNISSVAMKLDRESPWQQKMAHYTKINYFEIQI